MVLMRGSNPLIVETYEIPSKMELSVAHGLSSMWEKLGKPTSLEGDSAKKMMANIIHAWMTAYPKEAADWAYDLKEELREERTAMQSVKAGGYHIAAFPPKLYMLMRVVFPKVKFQEKKNVKWLVNNFPVFKTTNYRVGKE